YFTKFLFLSPLKVIISIPFAAFLVASVIASAVDSPFRPPRSLERDLSNALPFAIIVVICAVALLVRIVRVSGRLMTDIENFMQSFRQRAAVSASALLSQDDRKPTLFLRSFSDDQVAVREIAPLPYPLWRQPYQKRLEEIIADIAWYYGPLVALNDP